MKLEKGDVVNFHLNVSIRCLKHESIEIDLDDLRDYLNKAVNLYTLEHDL